MLYFKESSETEVKVKPKNHFFGHLINRKSLHRMRHRDQEGEREKQENKRFSKTTKKQEKRQGDLAQFNQ